MPIRDDQLTDKPALLPKTFLAICILEACLAIGLLLLYKLDDRSLGEFINGKFGIACLLTVLVACGGTTLLAREYFRHRQARSFSFTVVLNLTAIVLTVVLLEFSLRGLMFANPQISSLFDKGFLPKQWSDVAATNRRLLDNARGAGGRYRSFLVFDDRLGWTLSPSSVSANGLYKSSPERIRGPDTEFSYSRSSSKRRVALLGDSYTFGEGVAFKDTWGYLLQEMLGADFEVLNFGVPGYGIDQAYLRYIYEARKWDPEIAIFSFISHDLARSHAVYTPLAFPDWDLPFPKPRFELRDDALVPVNLPLPTPKEIFAASAPTDLPHIELEPSFHAPDWKWPWYHNLYVVRFVQSLFPNWPKPFSLSNPDVKALNTRILEEFVESAKRYRTKPLIVFFPSRGAGDLRESAPATPGDGIDILSNSGLQYLDATGCMLKVPPDHVFAADDIHYSATANLAAARCIYRYLRESGFL